MKRDKYLDIVREKLATIFNTQLHRDYILELLSHYDSKKIDVIELASGVKEASFQSRFLPIFNLLAPLVSLPDQIRWAETTPRYEPGRIETIVLKRQSTEQEFGFQLRGGFEQQQLHKTENSDPNSSFFFIDHVIRDTIAWHSTLFAGQRVLTIDNMSLRRTTMSELLMYIEQRVCITLHVHHYGMLPVRSTAFEPIKWQYVEQFERQRVRFRQRPISAGAQTALAVVKNDKNELAAKIIADVRQAQLPVRLCILDTDGASLGLTVGSSRKACGGLHIVQVEEKSLAEQVGLVPGDTIVEINGCAIESISETELLDEWGGGKVEDEGVGYYRQIRRNANLKGNRWPHRLCLFSEALLLLKTKRTLDLRVVRAHKP